MRQTSIATFLVLVLTTLAPVEAQAQRQSRSTVRLDVTRDTWVSDVGKEADGDNGGAPRLKLKSIQEMSLVDIDAKPLVGRTIRSAVLHVKKAGDDRLERVTVSTVGAEWFEGTGSGYAVRPGASTFRHRRHPDLPWSIGGGDICHVILGNGGTLWRMADASAPDSDGWQRVPVDPRVVAARVAGLSHGFLIFDDTGSQWTRNGENFTLRLFPNRFFYSRDQNRASAPYFTIELGPDDRRPPAAPSGVRIEPQTALLPAGEALVSWVTPRDSGAAGVLGFVVTLDGHALPRELVPLAARPDERVEMHLRDSKLAAGAAGKLAVRAVDGAGNVGPPATAAIGVSSRTPAPLPQPLPPPPRLSRAGAGAESPRVAGFEVAIVDELDKVHPLTGELIPSQPPDYLAANHLWSAADRRIALHAARNEFVAFQVLLRGHAGAGQSQSPVQPKLVFDGPEARAIPVEFGRYYPVATKVGPLPDPIVPLNFAADAGLDNATSRSLHVEIYVPHSLPAGVYRGTLTLTLSSSSSASRSQAAGTSSAPASLRLAVELRVWDFTLPDHLSFLPEMNCYGLPGNERDYYRLAHAHRTVLNRVPYSQNGTVADGCAPRWDRRGLDFDWSAWDRRFGPLLDGSAFADLPRKGVPVERFYLPLNESWPSPMEGNYNGDYWADRAFPEMYRRAFVAAARQMAGHFQAKRWTETLFEGFFNNKNNFKARGWSRGSSPWLLDEPANFQDYWALRYFALAFHEGLNLAAGAGTRSPGSLPRMVFRADISRPQWRRDSLDGLLDDLVVGSAMRTYPRLVFDRKRALGEIVLEYGSTNPVEGSNLQPVAWCLDVWSLGADGVVPWQTVGSAGSWDRADELSLLYPAPARGGGTDGPPAPSIRPKADGPPVRSIRLKADGAPVPSIRLKAYRRGQQDVEYLTLWSQWADEPRWGVGERVRSALKLAGRRQATDFPGDEDVGRMEYGSLRAGDVWSLRVAVGEALSRAHPAPKRKLVDFRTPRRETKPKQSMVVGVNAER